MIITLVQCLFIFSLVIWYYIFYNNYFRFSSVKKIKIKKNFFQLTFILFQCNIYIVICKEHNSLTDPHKLMCVNSSWSVSSSSDSSSLQGAGPVGEGAEPVEERAEPLEEGAGPSTLSLHSWGWWCFMRWRTRCTFARTEWLELVDWTQRRWLNINHDWLHKITS